MEFVWQNHLDAFHEISICSYAYVVNAHNKGMPFRAIAVACLSKLAIDLGLRDTDAHHLYPMFMSHISVSSTFINSFIEIRTIYHRNLGLSSPVPGISQAHPEQSA